MNCSFRKRLDKRVKGLEEVEVLREELYDF
jgi:hypothetical protein